MDDWQSCPLFAPEGAEIPNVQDGDDVDPALGALAHLLYDEETPEEVSEQHREHGNRLFRRGPKYLKAAIQHYTDAIDANCELPDVTGPAYSNRAAAHLKLKNYRRCLDDCERALALQPANHKARYRASIAATAVQCYDAAVAHCDIALSGSIDAQQKALFAGARKAALEAKRRDDERRVRAEKKATDLQSALLAKREAFSSRGITMGMPLFAQQRKYPRKEATSIDGRMYWPVLLLYPAEAIGIEGIGDQSDYLEEVSEDASLSDILATVFPVGGGDIPWDKRGCYKDHSNLEVLFRQEWTMPEDEADSDDERYYVGSTRGPEEVGSWRTLSKSKTLADAIATKGYIVPLFPVFYVVPRGVYLS